MLLEELQQRVSRGSEAQQHIEEYLTNKFGKQYKLVSTAPPSSKKPDLVANINGKLVQFEIKGRANPNAFIKLYERSVGRDDNDKTLNAFARNYTDGKITSFTELVDATNGKSSKFGFPGDKGVAKSGSVYFSTDEPAHLSKMRKYILQSLRDNGDEYFAVYNRGTHTVDYFYTGLGPNPLKAKRIPNFKQMVVDTYGGAYKNKMRVGIKVKLAR